MMKFMCIVTVLFLLPFSGWSGTFLETFDGRGLEAWQELIQLKEAPGSWEIVNDELHAISPDPAMRLLTTGDETWENYTIEFDVKPLKKHGIGAIVIAARVNGTWVVSCRVADPVVLVDGEARPGERIDCNYGNFHDVIFVLLHTEPHPLLRLNKWAHLKLSVQGNIVTFWINEKQIMEPTKFLVPKGAQHEKVNFDEWPDFLTGGVGFGLSNYTARFDNITVTGDSIPNSGGFAVTPHGKLTTTWSNLKLTAGR
ncbi:hypothetical protein C6500_05840 [Candidatus Poribacteria bacterium]|nr:MAG: hypothetical protein C6500_05840 [Candidatus Poribacteria bacterium]